MREAESCPPLLPLHNRVSVTLSHTLPKREMMSAKIYKLDDYRKKRQEIERIKLFRHLKALNYRDGHNPFKRSLRPEEIEDEKDTKD